MQPLSQSEFTALRNLIEAWSGISLADNKAYLLETRLDRLLRETESHSFAEFHRKLTQEKDPLLRQKVIDLMTTNETLWFRDLHPFDLLKKELLPEYRKQAQAGSRQTVRIWCAACSTGQEPYSVAMTILEALHTAPELSNVQFDILGTDISTSALRQAELACYESVAMSRGLPPSYRDRYFKTEGRMWKLNPEVTRMVHFKAFNLQDSFAPLGQFDVVLCRNVAIYFGDQLKRSLYAKMAKVLTPDGVLILGGSESLIAHSTDFVLQKTQSGVFYRLHGRAQEPGHLAKAA